MFTITHIRHLATLALQTGLGEQGQVPGGWVVEYIIQAELNGWLPRGPIESGTIGSIVGYLRFLASFDFSAVEPLY